MPMPSPRERPRKEKQLPPLFEWGECPSGIPEVVWEHSARPLWVQTIGSVDMTFLIEKERLLGRRISTGELLWEQESTPMPEELAADANGVVLTAGAHLRVLDPVDGSLRWRQRPGGPISGVALDDTTVYLATNGPLFALDRTNGRTRWKAPCSAEPELHTYPEADIVVVDDSEEESIRAFRRDDGAAAWEFSAEDEPVVAGPAIAGVLAVSCHGAGAAGVDLVSGDVRWQLETERGFEAPGVVFGDRLFLTDGRVHAVSPQTGQIEWRRGLEDEDDSIFSVRAAGTSLFAETWSGRLLCLDPADGRLRWERQIGQVHGLTADARDVYLRVSREGEGAGWAALGLSAVGGDLKWEIRSPKLIPDVTIVGELVVLELRTQALVLRRA